MHFRLILINGNDVKELAMLTPNSRRYRELREKKQQAWKHWSPVWERERERVRSERRVSMDCVFDLLFFHKILSHRAHENGQHDIATLLYTILNILECNDGHKAIHTHHYRLLWDLCRNDVIILPNDLGDLSSNERRATGYNAYSTHRMTKHTHTHTRRCKRTKDIIKRQ